MNRRSLGCLIPFEEMVVSKLERFDKWAQQQLVQDELRKQGYEEAYVLESYESMTNLGSTFYFTAKNLPLVPENKLIPQKNIGLVTLRWWGAPPLLEDRPLFELLG